jgi:hypothetical protein
MGADQPLTTGLVEADSGLQMSDIDGLATYPELPATGHAEVDSISIVSVNCMMAMLRLTNLAWHIQVGTTNIGGAVSCCKHILIIWYVFGCPACRPLSVGNLFQCGFPL